MGSRRALGRHRSWRPSVGSSEAEAVDGAGVTTLSGHGVVRAAPSAMARVLFGAPVLPWGSSCSQLAEALHEFARRRSAPARRCSVPFASGPNVTADLWKDLPRLGRPLTEPWPSRSGSARRRRSPPLYMACNHHRIAALPPGSGCRSSRGSRRSGCASNSSPARLPRGQTTLALDLMLALDQEIAPCPQGRPGCPGLR